MANTTHSVSIRVCNSCGGLIGSQGDFFLPSFKCPHRVERVGVMGDGGKWVCGLERIAPKKECVMYSFGADLVSLGTNRNSEYCCQV